MDEKKLYNDIMKASNGAIIAFLAASLEIIAEVKIRDKELSYLRNRMNRLLWEWQINRDDYLHATPPSNKEEAEILYSKQIYNLVERIYNRCAANSDPGVENTISAILYDICLYATWFLAGVERYYLGDLPKVYASDIFDVDDEYIINIIRLCMKCNDSYTDKIQRLINYMKEYHPLSNEEPLGKPVTREEVEKILQV